MAIYNAPKDKKKGFSISFERGVKQAEQTIKKDYNIAKRDIKIAEQIIKKDYNIAKKDINKIERSWFFYFIVTYGWAVFVILAAAFGAYWYQNSTIATESCDIVGGSGLLCENFDISNASIKIEIRNLNNKSIELNQITIKSCISNPNKKIPDNDKRMFTINCNITSGKFKEKFVVAYTIDNFQKHAVGKIAKVVP